MKIHIKGPSDYKISACTIVKNEEKTIARSIDSYKYFVNEIIILDTGSTDNTVKIAQEHGAKVYHYEWNNDFAAAKNAALEHATGDWIIFLDADEYFVENCGKRVRKAIAEAELRGNGSIGCRMINIDSNTGSVIAEIFSIRVLKKGFHYQYAVHEEPVREDYKGFLVADKTWFFLYHTGYTSKILKSKAKRNLDIMLSLLEIEKNPARRVAYKSYISDSYLAMLDHKNAIKYAKEFLKDAQRYDVKLVGCETKPYLNLIGSLQAIDADTDEIANWVNELCEKYPGYPDGVFASGCLSIRLRMFESAISTMDKAQELLNNYSDTCPSALAGNLSELYYNYGIACEGLLNIPDAISWYYKSFEARPEVDKPLVNLFRLIKKMPQDKLDGFVISLYSDKNEVKVKTVLTSLIKNYMTDQILKCYSVYRKSKDIDANAGAFILAGKGDYTGASRMFEVAFQILKDEDTAMRALICATLSGKQELIEECSNICTASQLFTLGLTNDIEKDKLDLTTMAKVINEMSILKGGKYAAELIKNITSVLNGHDLYSLTTKLERMYAFDAALAAAQFMDITPETVFLQGYILYRLRRFYEAEDLFALSEHMGYDKPALKEIRKYSNKFLADNKLTGGQLSEFKRRIELKINEGNFGSALEEIRRLKLIAEPDATILTDEAAIYYYFREYKKAAVAVETGLMKDEDNFDLLYNAGCIYEKIGDSDKASRMYRNALKKCSNAETKEDIEKSLFSLSRNGE